MTAHDLIVDIFSRSGPWDAALPANQRALTGDQLRYLRDLINQDPEGGAQSQLSPGVVMWRPTGRHKYIVREDLTSSRKKQHAIERLTNLAPNGMGCLF